ncbi:MAG: ABC transporter permease [Bacteroidetes bacterium]|nr:MAG: ABC transporter permease [Bacteroidota bacterium]
MTSVELFIAKRYLFSKRSIRFINVITFISILGITIGVAALLVVLSVFNGFSDVVTKVLVGFDPHIRIEKAGGISAEELQEVEKTLNSNHYVVASSPYISGKAMIVNGDKYVVAYVKGVEEKTIGNVSGLKESIIMGRLSLTDSATVEGIILGLSLADRLESLIGKEISLISPNDMLSIVGSLGLPSVKSMNVTGIFSASNREYDGNYAFISLASAQQMYHLGANVSGIEARLNNYTNAEQLKEDLQKQLPNQYIISTWQDLHKDLYFVMRLERWSGYIILSLIIVVACFNLMGSLGMSIIEKKRDIGVLQAIGLAPARVAKAFIYEGLLVGIIGTVCGIVLGLIVLYLQVNYQIFALDTSVFIIPAIPVKVEIPDFISVAFASLGLSLLSAYYPARKIAGFHPAESIRWE